MSSELSVWHCVLVFVGLIHVIIFVVAGETFSEPQVPCYFIFGDSLVDSGNNNGLTTTAKANYTPYGIDFPEGISGRFTNGLTVADIIGQLLGFPRFIPPYATATNEEINTGVNYGSGSAGIREESGSHLYARVSLVITIGLPMVIYVMDLVNKIQWINERHHGGIFYFRRLFRESFTKGNLARMRLPTTTFPSLFSMGDRISMDRQLLNHQNIISRLSALQSNKTFTDEYLKKCIYLSNIGSNDYIYNYFMPSIYPTNNTYTVDQYATALVQQYFQQLKTLYNMGARKIALFGLGQIGCTPTEITNFGTNGKPCVQWIDDAVKLFNDNLTSLVDNLNSNYSDARFTFINLTSISEPQGDVPELNATCCQVREDGQCVENSNPCFIRALTIFFDGFHPTEVSNRVIATRSYIALSPTDAYPYDISNLASFNNA